MAWINIDNPLKTCTYHSETRIASMIGGGVAASGAGGLYPRETCARICIAFFLASIAVISSLRPMV